MHGKYEVRRRSVRRTEGQFIAFKLRSYCFEEAIGFDVKASFARPPVSSLIKLGDITKEC